MASIVSLGLNRAFFGLEKYMAITRQKKEEITKELTDVLKKAKSVVFVSFHGLSVSEVNQVRKKLRSMGVGYLVAKKRLVKRVLSGMSLEGTLPELPGELAVAYGEDVIAPAKGIAEFKKKFKESLSSVGGIMEMRYLGAEEVRALASIPGREVLYGQFVTVIHAPVQQTVSVLNNIVSSFVVALDQIAQKKA